MEKVPWMDVLLLVAVVGESHSRSKLESLQRTVYSRDTALIPLVLFCNSVFQVFSGAIGYFVPTFGLKRLDLNLR